MQICLTLKFPLGIRLIKSVQRGGQRGYRACTRLSAARLRLRFRFLRKRNLTHRRRYLCSCAWICFSTTACRWETARFIFVYCGHPMGKRNGLYVVSVSYRWTDSRSLAEKRSTYDWQTAGLIPGLTWARLGPASDDKRRRPFEPATTGWRRCIS